MIVYYKEKSKEIIFIFFMTGLWQKLYIFYWSSLSDLNIIGKRQRKPFVIGYFSV